MSFSHARAALSTLVVAVALSVGLSSTPSTAAGEPETAARAAAYNPLSGGTWGVYTGSADGVYPAWQKATGADKELLAKVALRPRVRWFGHWIPTGDIRSKVADYIRQTQDGDPDVLVQMAVFRLWPRTEAAKDEPLTKADRRAYKRWVDQTALAIGEARVAMVLEPDLAVALKGWRPAVRLRLARYAAEVFGALPNTSVYLDGSDADWLRVDAAVEMLTKAGIEHVRGFALGATHYAGTAENVAYAGLLVKALAAAGVPGRHAVIDTADNGRPFTWLEFYDARPQGDFDNPPACTKPSQQVCVTLGIPPTADVAATKWGLPAKVLDTATAHVDGYLWFGRPWLYRQASPFDLKRTLKVAASTPY